MVGRKNKRQKLSFLTSQKGSCESVKQGEAHLAATQMGDGKEVENSRKNQMLCVTISVVELHFLACCRARNLSPPLQLKLSNVLMLTVVGLLVCVVRCFH